MLEYSYSRVQTFVKCPYAYKLRYLDNLDTLPDLNANDPLIVGTALHNALETDIDTALTKYLSTFYIDTNANEEECLKLATMVPKVNELLVNELDCNNGTVTFEYKLERHGFKGFIDYLIKRPDGSYEIYDFKYSNNVKSYKDSAQIHLYKYFFEKLNPSAKVTKIGYIMVPKILIRLKKTETIYDFRLRLKAELKEAVPTLVTVDYDLDKVKTFFKELRAMARVTEFPKNNSKLCMWCQFQRYCQHGEDYMLLPKNEPRDIKAYARKKVWIYGMPFSGKSTLADQFPSPLFLNTDGNINSFKAPVIQIRDVYEGPVLKTKAWEVFVDAIKTLSENPSTYQTVVVDLIEDVYEACRVWSYKELNIKHESEQAFVAWDFIRGHFLTEIKKLTSLPLNIVLISHEDRSRDITKKTGDKITSISPNIADKLANKIAGMVDVVMRLTCDKDGRYINFESSEVIFGGGRLPITKDKVACTYESINQVYNNNKTVEASKPKPQAQPKIEFANKKGV